MTNGELAADQKNRRVVVVASCGDSPARRSYGGIISYGGLIVIFGCKNIDISWGQKQILLLAVVTGDTNRSILHPWSDSTGWALFHVGRLFNYNPVGHYCFIYNPDYSIVNVVVLYYGNRFVLLVVVHDSACILTIATKLIFTVYYWPRKKKLHTLKFRALRDNRCIFFFIRQ